MSPPDITKQRTTAVEARRCRKIFEKLLGRVVKCYQIVIFPASIRLSQIVSDHAATHSHQTTPLPTATFYHQTIAKPLINLKPIDLGVAPRCHCRSLKPGVVLPPQTGLSSPLLLIALASLIQIYDQISCPVVDRDRDQTWTHDHANIPLYDPDFELARMQNFLKPTYTIWFGPKFYWFEPA